MKSKKIIYSIILLVVLLSGIQLFLWLHNNSNPKVSPASPEATSTPPQTTQLETNGILWKTLANDSLRISFQYPENLPTTYIHAVDWPPQIQLSADTSFSCTEAGSEITRAGKTEKGIIQNNVYCITKESEGAAGSVYTQYAYVFPKNGHIYIFTFSIRLVQCDNYDEPQRTACKNERARFDMNELVNQIAQSIHFE